jgi:anti-sigma factor RsiW
MAITNDFGRRCDWAPEVGTLRAISDSEVVDGWRPDLEAHLRNCEECRERSQALRTTASLVHGRLVALAAADGLRFTPPSFETVRAATTVPWHLRVFANWIRPDVHRSPWVVRTGAVAAAVALAVSWPAVSSFADGAFQSFRVQRVQPITVDAEALRSRFVGLPIDEGKVREAVRYRGPDKPTITITSQADAASRSGMTLRLPKTVPPAVSSKPPKFVVTSGGVSEMTVDGPKLVEVAKEAKVTDSALLTRIGGLHGVTIKVEGYPAVAAVWGDVDIPTQVPSGKAAATLATPTARGPMMMIGQMKSPVVNVPVSVDLDGLRDSLMKSGSVPPEVVQALGAVKDWRMTLPVPSGSSTGLRQADVDGTSATVSTRTVDGKSVTTVVWIRDGVIFGAVGDLPEADLLTAVRSLASAKS